MAVVDLVKKCSVLKIKFFALTVAILCVYLFLSYVALEVWFVKNNSKRNLLKVELANVIVHIDLKSAPLKLTYLKSLLPTLKKLGVTGLLMEYEDMFPYEGKLANLSAEHAYPKSELRNFLSTVSQWGFEIIPLVQTFGHLEYALKLEEFKQLREVPTFPDSICPSKLESKAFLRHMVEQVIDLHLAVAPLKYIHIGCDEVFHMNKCQHCRRRKVKNKDLFFQHIKQLTEVVESLSPDTEILIWDDMLRNIKPKEWNDVESFSKMHPVYWDYSPSLQVTHQNLLKYHRKFPQIWIASAFKGADGKMVTFPDIRNRFLNHFSWMNMILGYTFGGENQIYNFKGIIVTGWSRYSHMDPPCEILPVSIPSLILNLLVVKKFKTGIDDVQDDNEAEVIEVMFKKHLKLNIEDSLKCSLNLNHLDYKQCQFDGKELFTLMAEHKDFLGNLSTFLNNEKNSVGSIEYYVKLDNLNMNSVLEIREQLEVNLDEIIQLEDRIVKEMRNYYHKDFVTEYINYKSFQLKGRIVKLLSTLDNYATKRIWRRRAPNNKNLFPIKKLS